MSYPACGLVFCLISSFWVAISRRRLFLTLFASMQCGLGKFLLRREFAGRVRLGMVRSSLSCPRLFTRRRFGWPFRHAFCATIRELMNGSSPNQADGPDLG